MGREKRRHRRERITAEVYYKEDKKLSTGGCIAKDISLGGVCVKIGSFFPVGSILELQFKLPLSEETFYVKGKVMWINKRPYSEEWDVGFEILEDRIYLKLVQQYMYLKSTTYTVPPEEEV